MTSMRVFVDRSPRQLFHVLLRWIRGQERLSGFNEKHPCVFVLSTGRTGTQTLAALFRLAGNVLAYHEPRPKLYELSKLSYQYSDDAKVRQVLKAAFLVAREKAMSYSLYCGKGYIETSPHVTFLAPIVLEAISNVRFIHLVRDPRDVVRSGMRRRWYDGNRSDRTRIVPRSDSASHHQWESYSTFQKNVWLWAETNRWILSFFSELPADRALVVRSERVFEADTETMRKLFAFVGAPMPLERKIMRVLRKRLNVQRVGMFPEPSSWSEAMRNDLSAIAGETASALGYKLE